MEESNKENSKHAPDHKHAVHHKKKLKMSKLNMWKSATFLFAVLLIASIFTNGFRPCVTGDVIDKDELLTPSNDDGLNEGGELKLLVLNDKRCDECMTNGEMLIGQLETIFTNMEVQRVDYNDDEGKEMYESLELIALPAFLFNKEVMNESGYTNVAQYLVQKGEYLSLSIGANFNPTKEICDNGIDDTENGLIDCEDSDCINTLVCNPDMFSECAVEQGLTPETVIFYYSESCPWCTLMKPGVEQLIEEGYLIKSVQAGNPQDEVIIDACFRDYMDGGVPQFICPKTTEIWPGAFTDMDQNIDLDRFRDWVDDCIEG
jgi:hypothetical protein